MITLVRLLEDSARRIVRAWSSIDDDKKDIPKRPQFRTLPAGTKLYHGTHSPKNFGYPRGPAWFTEHENLARDFIRDGKTKKVLIYQTKKPLKLLAFPKYQDLFDWINRWHKQNIDYTYDAADFIANKTDFDGWVLYEAYLAAGYDAAPSESGDDEMASDIMICEPRDWLEPAKIKTKDSKGITR
jgi:hypothetical protein